MNTLTIGVDVSFKTLDVAVAIDSERATTLGRFTNSEAGFKELAAKLEREAQGATIYRSWSRPAAMSCRWRSLPASVSGSCSAGSV